MDMPNAFETQIEKANTNPWVVFSEACMAGAEHVIRYLGQYTHRVAISNQRFQKIDKIHITFIAKDYRDRAVKKPVTLDGIEFLRRFTMHILPKRFVKIRRYGIYNHTVKRNMSLHFISEKKISNVKEKSIPPETKQKRFERLTDFNFNLCQECKTGRMITVRELSRIRSPGLSFLSFFSKY